MKKTLSTSEAAHLLVQDKNASWSYEGARLLVEYLEQYEDGGEEIEFDAVAIRCDFTEYPGLQTWALDYFGPTWRDALDIVDDEFSEDMEETNEAIREYINDHGTLLEGDSCVVVSSF